MIPVRLHDRYVLKAFWSTFGAVILFFTLISVLMDVSERLSRLLRYWDHVEAAGHEPLLVLAEFYATFIPFVWLRTLPFCVPVAAMFCLSRLNRHNELAPLLTAGVSMRRILLPLVLSGVFVMLLMMGARQTVVPDLSRRHMTLSRILQRDAPDRMPEAPHFHDTQGRRLSMAAYRPIARKMDEVEISVFSEDGSLVDFFRFPELEWNEADRRWIASQGGVRIPNVPGAPGSNRIPIDAGEVAPIDAPVSLIEITMLRRVSLGLSYGESAKLMRANRDNPRFVMMHHELFTGPASALVLLLITLPFCQRIGTRTGHRPEILMAVGVALLYFAGGFLAGSLGGAGELSPVVLAWLPTILFGSLGLALYLGVDA